MRLNFAFVLFLTVCGKSLEKRTIQATILLDLELQANLEIEAEQFVEDFFNIVNVFLSPLEVEIDVKTVVKETEQTRLITVKDENNSSIGVSLRRTTYLSNPSNLEDLNNYDKYARKFMDLDIDYENAEFKKTMLMTNSTNVILALTQLDICDDNLEDENLEGLPFCTSSKSGIRGRASHNGACVHNNNLAIIQVLDRRAPFTAAHEIGHLLGVDHDDRTQNVMESHSTDDRILAWYYDELWTPETIKNLRRNLEDPSKNCIQKTESISSAKQFVWNRWMNHLKVPKRRATKRSHIGVAAIPASYFKAGMVFAFGIQIVFETLDRKFELFLKLHVIGRWLAEKTKSTVIDRFRRPHLNLLQKNV